VVEFEGICKLLEPVGTNIFESDLDVDSVLIVRGRSVTIFAITFRPASISLITIVYVHFKVINIFGVIRF